MALGINMVGEINHKIISFASQPGEDEDPALFLYKEGRFGRSAIIPLESAFKYNEPKTPQDMHIVIQSCRNIAQALDLPTDKRALIQIAMQIQDKLDDLVGAAPEETPPEYAGAAEVELNGQKMTMDLEL